MKLYYFLKGYIQTVWYERSARKKPLQFKRQRQKRLKKQLSYIHKHSIYYNQHVSFEARENLDAYPVMQKEEWMQHLDTICTIPIHRETLISEAKLAEQSRDFSKRYKGYVYGLSSGTSGNQGVFLLSNREIALWSGVLFAKVNFFKTIGFKKTRIAFFMRANNDLYQSVGKFHIKFQFFDIFNTHEANMDALLLYQPTLLVGQPSVLINIARTYKEQCSTHQISHIFSIAERLEPHIQEEIESIFNVPVRQIYQATEGFIGITHCDGNTYLNEDNFIIEKAYLDEEKRRYNPIITDLERKTQPIIRYKMNDILIDHETQDGIFTKLECIEGRNDEVCFFAPNHRIYPDEFRTCILTHTKELRDFHLDVTKHAIKITIDGEESMNLERGIQELLDKHKVEDVSFEIIYGHIQRDKTKKLKRIEYNGGS